MSLIVKYQLDIDIYICIAFAACVKLCHYHLALFFVSFSKLSMMTWSLGWLICLQVNAGKSNSNNDPKDFWKRSINGAWDYYVSYSSTDLGSRTTWVFTQRGIFPVSRSF